MKISSTAHELLLAIEHACSRPWCAHDSFWVPPKNGSIFVPKLGRSIWVHGSGVASALRSLAKKGLTAKACPGRLGFEYAYSITQAGRDWLGRHPDVPAAPLSQLPDEDEVV